MADTAVGTSSAGRTEYGADNGTAHGKLPTGTTTTTSTTIGGAAGSDALSPRMGTVQPLADIKHKVQPMDTTKMDTSSALPKLPPLADTSPDRSRAASPWGTPGNARPRTITPDSSQRSPSPGPMSKHQKLPAISDPVSPTTPTPGASSALPPLADDRKRRSDDAQTKMADRTVRNPLAKNRTGRPDTDRGRLETTRMGVPTSSG